MKIDFQKKSARPPKKFNPTPFEYHQEIELEITTLTNLGEGLGRYNGWVVMVPFALPGEKIIASIWHNAKQFSRGDLVKIITPSPDRVEPICPLFKNCGGCQYQNLNYSAQLKWKTQQISELLKKIGHIEFPVNKCFPSPKSFGYRSKITPHFERAPLGEKDFPIGFLQEGSRKIIDIPACPIATEAINNALPKIRENMRTRAAQGEFKRGVTILMRETLEGVITDHKAPVSERVDNLVLKFVAGDFFQNNPFILPAFVDFGVKSAAKCGCKYLVDTYCGSGLFALSAAKYFDKVLGVEVSEDAVIKARENAKLNKLNNCEFVAGSSEIIFDKVSFPANETAVIIDPPRKGCDDAFISQLLVFAPKRIIYVSCGPDTQARDLKIIIDSQKYALEEVQPFDLFPQTRHIENIAVLKKII